MTPGGSQPMEKHMNGDARNAPLAGAIRGIRSMRLPPTSAERLE